MRVCFTGHRKISAEHITQLAASLASLVSRLSSQGPVTFFAGGAVGFDTLAALTVLTEREHNPNVRLELILPCPEQANGWSDSDIEKYNFILNSADRVTYVSDSYDQDCMFRRNRALVDSSELCVAYLVSDKGGTMYTANYAESKNVKLINLAK